MLLSRLLCVRVLLDGSVSAYGISFFDYFPTNVLQEFLKRVIPDCLTGTLTSFLLDRQIETILINSSYVARDGKG